MKQFMIGAAVLATISVSAIANAQFADHLDARPYGLSFRFGGDLALDSKMRDLNKVFYGVGLDYDFTHEFIPNSVTFISIDWMGRTVGNDAENIFPVCINQRFYLDKGAEDKFRRPYVLAGIGATIYDTGASRTKFGARIGAGLELGPNIFAEADFYTADKNADGITAAALGLFLGYRFR